jgi:3D (Asp-Asp-Asp) domain-containing protein
MAKWLVWLLAVTTAIFASPLPAVQPAVVASAKRGACVGTLHCDGPPAAGARPVRSAAGAARSAPPQLLRAAALHATRILTPAEMSPNLPLGDAPGDVLLAGGQTFAIVSRIQMLASTYQTGEPGVGTITATGTHARVGEVAVDPRFIPLGTWMFVTGYHTPYFPPQGILEHAEDTGGAIKGDRLDMYMDAPPQALAQFAGQWVTVYILVPRVAGTAPALPDGTPR